jgi:hypothetical protein
LLWKKLDLSYTPSSQYAHKVALRLLSMHGAFEELVEDFRVERMRKIKVASKGAKQTARKKVKYECRARNLLESISSRTRLKLLKVKQPRGIV